MAVCSAAIEGRRKYPVRSRHRDEGSTLQHREWVRWNCDSVM